MGDGRPAIDTSYGVLDAYLGGFNCEFICFCTVFVAGVLLVRVGVAVRQVGLPCQRARAGHRTRVRRSLGNILRSLKCVRLERAPVALAAMVCGLIVVATSSSPMPGSLLYWSTLVLEYAAVPWSTYAGVSLDRLARTLSVAVVADCAALIVATYLVATWLRASRRCATEEVQPKWPLDSSGVPAAKDELQLSIIVLRAAAHGLDSPEALPPAFVASVQKRRPDIVVVHGIHLGAAGTPAAGLATACGLPYFAYEEVPGIPSGILVISRHPVRQAVRYPATRRLSCQDNGCCGEAWQIAVLVDIVGHNCVAPTWVVTSFSVRHRYTGAFGGLSMCCRPSKCAHAAQNALGLACAVAVAPDAAAEGVQLTRLRRVSVGEGLPCPDTQITGSKAARVHAGGAGRPKVVKQQMARRPATVVQGDADAPLPVAWSHAVQAGAGLTTRSYGNSVATETIVTELPESTSRWPSALPSGAAAPSNIVMLGAFVHSVESAHIGGVMRDHCTDVWKSSSLNTGGMMGGNGCCRSVFAGLVVLAMMVAAVRTIVGPPPRRVVVVIAIGFVHFAARKLSLVVGRQPYVSGATHLRSILGCVAWRRRNSSRSIRKLPLDGGGEQDRAALPLIVPLGRNDAAWVPRWSTMCAMGMDLLPVVGGLSYRPYLLRMVAAGIDVGVWNTQ